MLLVFGSAEDKVKIKEEISSIAYGTAQTNLDVVNFDNDDDRGELFKINRHAHQSKKLPNLRNRAVFVKASSPVKKYFGGI